MRPSIEGVDPVCEIRGRMPFCDLRELRWLALAALLILCPVLAFPCGNAKPPAKPVPGKPTFTATIPAPHDTIINCPDPCQPCDLSLIDAKLSALLARKCPDPCPTSGPETFHRDTYLDYSDEAAEPEPPLHPPIRFALAGRLGWTQGGSFSALWDETRHERSHDPAIEFRERPSWNGALLAGGIWPNGWGFLVGPTYTRPGDLSEAWKIRPSREFFRTSGLRVEQRGSRWGAEAMVLRVFGTGGGR